MFTLCFIRGDARAADPCQEIGFRGQKLKRFFGCVLSVFPRCGGFGAIFFGPASSAQLGLRFSLFDISIYLGFCRGDGSSYMRCHQGNRGPDKPHDAHDAGLLGAA